MTAITLFRAERGYAGLALLTAPDRLIVATRDGTIEVWSLAELDAAPSVVRAAFLRPARAFASGLPAIQRLAVHGTLAAVAGAGTVQLHDVVRGSLVRELPIARGARCEAIAFTPDGRHLLVAADERIATIEAATGRIVDQVSGGERTPSIAVHPGGGVAHLACHQGGSRLVVDQLRDGVHRAGAPRSLDLACDVATSACFSPDGSLLALATRDVQIHRVADLSLTHAFDYWGEPVAAPAARSVEARWSTTAFSPDGRYLVCGTPLGGIVVWDIALGRTIARHARHDEAVVAVAVDPSGERIFSCAEDRTLRAGPLS